jgi:uncharacterized protein (DUF488 family)
MKIYTIGFTQKTAEEFFSTLRQPGLFRILDIRLNNRSQYAGFTKLHDLPFFLKTILGISYHHLPDLAPTKAMLDAYKKKKTIDWPDYKRQFETLMTTRQIETTVQKDLCAGGCLLCSEVSPDFCHRRLVAEYLQMHWGNLEIVHL